MSLDPSRGALPPKLYFRIGEVANLVGVEPHVLRYWEREFRSIRPSKSAKGQRVYSRRDVENLLRVRELLYGQGFTIAGAKKRLRDKDAVPEDGLDGSPEGAVLAATTVAPETQTAIAVPPPGASNDVQLRVRKQLEALKAEVEAFLDELGT